MVSTRRRAAAIFLLCAAAASAGCGAFSTPSPVTSPKIRTPVVICPGFGNDSIDYEAPLSQPREVGFISALERRGFDPEAIYTVPVKRRDWVRVAGGLLDPGFYTNKALPTGRGYGWYVRRLQQCVNEAYEASGGEKVLLIGHSAGGWLARAAMGDGVWAKADGGGTETRTAERIRCLATIGAIHRPPQDLGTCVTRGALAYTNEMYPGAFLKAEGVAYVSVGGDAIVGNNAKDMPVDPTDADEAYRVRGEGNAQRVAFTSYEAVCGQGEVTGDGVVPLEWSILRGSDDGTGDGAVHLSLDNTLHSINEAGTTLPTDRWYGAEDVVDRWLPTVLEEAGIVESKKANMQVGGFADGLAKLWRR